MVRDKTREEDTLIWAENNGISAGMKVTQGSAKGLVVQTGVNTEIGKIQRGILSVNETKTPLGNFMR